MEDITKRIKTAVEFLKDGQSFNVGELRFGIGNSNCIYVTGWTQYLHLENLTKQLALKELNNIKTLFNRMVSTSTELRDFAQGKSIEYNLAFNYGQGAIGICTEKDGVLKWEHDLKTSSA